MEKLHPGAKWSFRLGFYVLAIVFLIFFGFWLVVPLFLLFKSVLAIVLSLFFGFVLVIILGEIYARMSYTRWLYEFSSDGLKIERGIIWKRYSNIPYERIQNVDVRRGVLARMLGFSSIMIQTAGYSGRAGSEGYLPAVDMKKAEEIRTLVMKKITGRRH